MAGKSFRGLFEEAEQHDDYWAELAMVEVTEEVARRMEELGVSRAELARRLGTSPAYVTKMLRGNANFTLATIAKLARALESEVRFGLSPRRHGEEGLDEAEFGKVERRPVRLLSKARGLFPGIATNVERERDGACDEVPSRTGLGSRESGG